MEDLDAVVLGKMEADVDFQNSLVDLSDEDKESAIATKKSELIKQEFSTLSEKAKKAEEAEKKFNDQKTRAEKAERELKEKVEPKDSSLSTKDVLYIAKADIHEDDLDEVLEWAKFKKISVPEAHKQLKGALDVRAEERRTADAANVSAARRGPSKISDEVLIDKASKGELPEDDAGIERLISAKLKKR